MEGPTPARLYATTVGALLFLAGIVGFFYSSSFGHPGTISEMFGLFAVNGWLNVLHAATGSIGLFLAGWAARRFALWIGSAYLALGIWGLILGGEASILGFLPINLADDLLHLGIGVLGVVAALASPVPGARGRTRRRTRPKRVRRAAAT